jgi:hypothetical protein
MLLSRTVSFVHGCFVGKCILSGTTEWRYYKIDGIMEKKWDTVIPADVERLFLSGHESVKLSEPCVLYIGRAYRYPPDVVFYIFLSNKYKY